MRRRRFGRLAGSIVLAMAVAVAGAFAAVPAGATTTLRVMSFNIFYGGDELNPRTGSWCHRKAGCAENFAKAVEAVEASGADVVGLQEALMNTRKLAEALGWHYDERMHVISRYPLVDPPGADGLYTLVEVLPGEVAAIANVHLTSDPYGPYEIQAGATAAEITQLETTVRLPEVQRHLAELPGLAGAGVPVFLTGDFNSPSHLDWTPEVATARGDVPFAFAWPVSAALAGAGFRDSYRDAYPDPVATPGFTWTPGGPESIRDEVHDRIDWVLATGPSTTLDSRIVGEPDGPDVDVEIGPYPTDHRGVVSTFEITPAAMPTLVAVDARRVEAGGDLGVRFHGTADRVALVAAGNGPGAAVASQPTGGAGDGTLAFGTGGLAPGAYEALLVDASDAVLARIPFWVVAAGAKPQVWTSKSTYAVGEPIEVSWKGAYGLRFDWFGVYSPGANDGSPSATGCAVWTCGNQRYLLYEYLHAEIEGTTAFDRDSFPGWASWPLQPGSYEIRLLLDDGYRSVASSARFRIVRA